MNGLDALGVASSIIGVLTFIVAVIASITGFYALTVEAEAEIKKFKADLELLQTHKEDNFCWRAIVPDGSKDVRHLGQLNDDLELTVNKIKEGVTSLEKHFAKVTPKSDEGWRHFRLVRRIRWAFKRQEVLGELQYLSSQRLALVALHMHLLLWYCLLFFLLSLLLISDKIYSTGTAMTRDRMPGGKWHI
ncbi:uncharacterized protein V1513DRAFT_455137 [Lipomyces chichibuensis]|uniref:uncharacterized protein n=1 Tax=Lipomyces chichibuensis TaxID=1546026 RepID=UPI0033438225